MLILSCLQKFSVTNKIIIFIYSWNGHVFWGYFLIRIIQELCKVEPKWHSFVSTSPIEWKHFRDRFVETEQTETFLDAILWNLAKEYTQNWNDVNRDSIIKLKKKFVEN